MTLSYLKAGFAATTLTNLHASSSLTYSRLGLVPSTTTPKSTLQFGADDQVGSICSVDSVVQLFFRNKKVGC
jgi:hypothetical protein